MSGAACFVRFILDYGELIRICGHQLPGLHRQYFNLATFGKQTHTSATEGWIDQPRDSLSVVGIRFDNALVDKDTENKRLIAFQGKWPAFDILARFAEKVL